MTWFTLYALLMNSGLMLVTLFCLLVRSWVFQLGHLRFHAWLFASSSKGVVLPECDICVVLWQLEATDIPQVVYVQVWIDGFRGI